VTDTLEQLEALDQKVQTILPLLTQAVQATQEAEALIEQIPGNTAPSLVAALPNLRTALHTGIDNHNTLVAEIAAARAAVQAHPEQYQPESI
jgi:hypothetical protein